MPFSYILSCENSFGEYLSVALNYPFKYNDLALTQVGCDNLDAGCCLRGPFRLNSQLSLKICLPTLIRLIVIVFVEIVHATRFE